MIPVLDPKERTLKDWIIFTLLKRHPLDARKLMKEINRVAGSEYGYSAVYQAVEKLCLTGVVQGVGDKYSHQGYTLNLRWIEQMQSLINEAEIALLQDQKHPLAQILGNLETPPEFHVLHRFSCLRDLETWIIDFAAEEKARISSSSDNFWFHILYPDENREMIKKVLSVPNTEITGVCGYDTPVARLAISWSKPLGQKVAINPTVIGSPHFFAIGDYVLYCHYPPSIVDDMTKRFAAVKKIGDLPSAWELYSLLEKKDQAPLLILKDQGMAKEIHEQIRKKYQQIQ